MSHWQSKMVLRPTDLKFSWWVRVRDGACVFRIKCNGANAYQGESQEEYLKRLTNSHFEGRRKESTRFDPENCDTACRSCHEYLETHKDFYREWKLEQLGAKRYNALIIRANTIKKRDDAMDKIIIKQLLKEQEDENSLCN